MAQRETILAAVLQQWRGINQRTQPTLVQDGFFVMARGVFFGLGDNAERIPGKKLAGALTFPIFNICVFGDNVLVQGISSLSILPISDLLAGTILPDPKIMDETGDFVEDETGDIIKDS